MADDHHHSRPPRPAWMQDPWAQDQSSQESWPRDNEHRETDGPHDDWPHDAASQPQPAWPPRQEARRSHRPADDPLAELARLIGQSNAAYAQPPQYGTAERTADNADDRFVWSPPRAGRASGADEEGPAQDYPAASGRWQPPRPQPRDPYDDSGGDPYYQGDPLAVPQAPVHPVPTYAPAEVPSAARYVQAPAEPGYPAPPYEPPQFASPHYEGKPYPAYDNQLYFEPAPQDVAAYAAADHSGAPDYGAPPPDLAHAPEEGIPEMAEALPRRRGRLPTVIAVLALAVVGTAAAFGYRTVFVAKNTGMPPLIKADTTPSKTIPATSDSTKPIQDRVGAQAQAGRQAERLVAREEQPVAVNPARAGLPRVVLPGENPIAPLPHSPIPPALDTGAAPPAATASVLPQVPPAPQASPSAEPKKVRTVTIRSDQPAAAAIQAPAAIPAQRPAETAPAGPGAPLALSPGAVSGGQQRQAPARTASIPPAAGGGYGVQVTSQRSEAEAQSAFAALQARYPGVLGGRQAVIRRADLGEKGVYYRAQVPFGSQAEAVGFCTSLKNAGGQCVVQRN